MVAEKRKRKAKPTEPDRPRGKACGHGPKAKSCSPGTPSDEPVAIVGIGASAGGLEALEGFFDHLPPKSGIAYVVIQHLAPQHKSVMDAILSKHTGMRINRITSGMKAEPDNIYLNQPDKDVTIVNGLLCLAELEEPHGIRLPIDRFLRSLAADRGEKAVCVILSGTGSDGTQGLKAIKETGGMAMVQEKEQARYEGMPASALATGLVDFELPVEDMADEIMKFASHTYVRCQQAVTAPEEDMEGSFARIFSFIRSETGHDFSGYKRKTTQRRIERRMALHGIDAVDAYVTFLREDSNEVKALYRDMLITVTSFFREPEAFEVLEKTAVHELLDTREPDTALRVWVPGCGTGEEAYSIAILIAEHLAARKRHLEVQVFATDLDDGSIEYARAGVYPASIAADVKAKRLERFFVSVDGSWRIKRRIREMLVFAVQDLIKDPPFSNLDLISCRNVLIYLDGALQKEVLSLFHYVLRPGGYLFLGSAETIGGFGDRFETVDSKHRIYRRKEAIHGEVKPHGVPPFFERRGRYPLTGEPSSRSASDIRGLAHRAIIDKYTPPCVLINGRHEILYFHGDTDKYLASPAGEASLDILKMIRPEIRYKLSGALHSVSKGLETVVCDDLTVVHGCESVSLDLVVKPVEDLRGAPGMMLVVFEERRKPKPARRRAGRYKADHPEDSSATALQQELASTKEHLQAAIEELETSNEELRSANEELQSTNEELQSTNEELETAREELRSSNEELETVATEREHKIQTLSKAHDDLNNLLASTDIGTIFLDLELRIKFFTPPTTAIFNVIETDIGRPISDITTAAKYAGLDRDAREVLTTLTKKETEVQTTDGRWFTVKMLPYRTTDNVINGVVITFTDVTRIKRAREHLAISRVALAAFMESATDGMMLFDSEGNLIEMNSAALELFPRGIRKEDVTGESIAKVLGLIGQGDRAEDYYATLETGIPFIDGERQRHPRIAGRYFSARVFRTGTGIGVILADETIQVEFDKADKARRYAERIVDSVREPMLVLDSGLRVISASAAFFSEFAAKPRETLGLQIHEIGNALWDIPELRDRLEKTLASGLILRDLVVERDLPGIGRRKMLLNGRRLKIAKGEPVMLLLTIENISEDAPSRANVTDTACDR